MSQHIKHHPAQSSRTLMRRAVHKPGPVSQDKLRSVRSPQPVKSPAADLAPQLSVGKVESKRLARAYKVPKSRLVSRFSASIFRAS